MTHKHRKEGVLGPNSLARLSNWTDRQTHVCTHTHAHTYTHTHTHTQRLKVTHSSTQGIVGNSRLGKAFWMRNLLPSQVTTS